jgi:acyl-coenzyme A thioesterase PaaI-like protein
MNQEQIEPRQVAIWTGNVVLGGVLSSPADSAGVAILVSGPGSQARDQRLVEELNRIRIATLQVGLLTDDEQQFDSRTGHYRYDADFLAHRLIEVAQWLPKDVALRGLPIAYVGTTIGAASALVAAALRPDIVSVVVAINGRTDLAADYLRTVKTPTLFVLNDMPVLRMNRDALAQIKTEKRIEVIHADDGQAQEIFVQKAVRWIADKLALVAEPV